MEENKQEDVIEIFCWSDHDQDYVLVYRGFDEKEAKRARRLFLSRQTRARNKAKREGGVSDGR